MRQQPRVANGVALPDGPPPLRSDEVPNPWISSSGRVAHPDSPQGAGGPGNFRMPGAVDGIGKQSFTVPQPSTFRGRNHVLSADDATALEASKKTPPKKNPPPVTKPETFQRSVPKNAHNMKVELTLKILADATDQAGVPADHATTGIVPDTMTAGFNWAEIAPDDDVTKKVTTIDGTNKLEGMIELRIRYAKGVSPKNKVAYGRGTTESDIVNGDITIGFHEHCHLNDWWNYLKTEALSLEFEGKVGMTVADYQQKQTDLENKFQDFIDAGDALTLANTDEVGDPTRSEFLNP